ncbi:MAG: PilZ domain-containing protein [Deltaproteobacteria bacterium]|nr:PilZ domain-containing protein [Deltaproteobacteria bacterium]
MTSSGKASERRDGPRIDLRLRVRWSAQTSAGPVSGEAEASDVSPKGLRLESEHKVDQGAALALVVDVGGDDDELIAAGSVMWCRERQSQTGKIIYDVGVAFESDWLSKDRGPLGQALARIFAMNSYEPARSFERTPIAIVVDGGILGKDATLSMVNLSIGGMQLKCTGGVVDVVRAGMAVTVAIDAEDRALSLVGKVAWVAAASEGDSRFGVELANVSAPDKEVLERIRNGQSEPTRVAVTLKS